MKAIATDKTSRRTWIQRGAALGGLSLGGAVVSADEPERPERLTKEETKSLFEAYQHEIDKQDSAMTFARLLIGWGDAFAFKGYWIQDFQFVGIAGGTGDFFFRVTLRPNAVEIPVLVPVALIPPNWVDVTPEVREKVYAILRGRLASVPSIWPGEKEHEKRPAIAT